MEECMVSLKEINIGNFDSIIELKVDDRQKNLY
jgi:hypothetical protein